MINKEAVDLILYGISGTGATIVAVGVGLKKAGLLHLGRKEGLVRNGSSEQSKQDHSHIPCMFHKDMQRVLERVNETQIKNVEKLEYHEKSLSAGEKRFDDFGDDISELKEGLGILMDRTGGRPNSWRTKK